MDRNSIYFRVVRTLPALSAASVAYRTDRLQARGDTVFSDNDITQEIIMSYEQRDAYGMYVDHGHKGPGPELMGADTLIGDHVHNLQNEHLGEIKEIMLDMRTGRIAYAVMSHGGIFTMGQKLFAVPWEALTLDLVNKRFTLDIAKERIENAPGFDSDNWPNMANQAWVTQIQTYYSSTPYSGADL
jgi:sporulation protein YlmC with PRC-barrel domain